MNPGFFGYLIGLAFSVYWLRVGAAGVGGTAGTVIFLSGSVLLVGLLWRVWRDRFRRTDGARFRWPWYLAAVAAEIVALNVAVVTLPKSFLTAYQAPVVGAIVGLHFIGLWLATNMRRFLYLSGGMTALNLGALLLPATHAPAIFAGLGSAVALAAAVAA